MIFARGMRVTIHADHPALPPGRRLVELVELGRKWVRIRLPGRVRCKRVSRQDFEDMRVKEDA